MADVAIYLYTYIYFKKNSFVGYKLLSNGVYTIKITSKWLGNSEDSSVKTNRNNLR